eukprot:1703702-Rhodomonas_salina.1
MRVLSGPELSIVLRLCYAMSGTDIYILLRVCYAISGTESGSGGGRRGRDLSLIHISEPTRPRLI